MKTTLDNAIPLSLRSDGNRWFREIPDGYEAVLKDGKEIVFERYGSRLVLARKKPQRTVKTPPASGSVPRGRVRRAVKAVRKAAKKK